MHSPGSTSGKNGRHCIPRRDTSTEATAAPVKRTAAVIFSHGLGDSSAGWSFLADQLDLSSIVCPPCLLLSTISAHWPYEIGSIVTVQVLVYVSNNNHVFIGSQTPQSSLFDILSFEPDATVDEKGFLERVKTIQALVDMQVQAGIPSDRIVVRGFSQGQPP
ncbi:uncharacterized protein VP01_2291g3 [Puccinia sorghi]|uniref:Acyl-protein thioesterase 1 n=1 Tax=Puccinia sorghi TaxID=27349 RepID=A0A0L6V8Q7_9BASI|nr:uncharacterized protein VP01_2291g3 [Puccinia sorghi]